MNPQTAIDLTRDALWMSLLIGAPVLVAGLVVGLLIGLMQALTQIQEQTLVFVPKIAAMIAAAILIAPWLANHLMTFAAAMFGGDASP